LPKKKILDFPERLRSDLKGISPHFRAPHICRRLIRI
jgi:hypothetical protein